MALLHESDPTHGGAPLAFLVAECPDDLRESLFSSDRPVTPWHRVRDFQLVSLKSLARELLLATPTFAKATSSELVLYVPGEVASEKLTFSHQGLGGVRKQRGVRLAYSKHNPGAPPCAKQKAPLARSGQPAMWSADIRSVDAVTEALGCFGPDYASVCGDRAGGGCRSGQTEPHLALLYFANARRRRGGRVRARVFPSLRRR